MDIYLPDFKYASAGSASRYSAAGDYADVVKAALDIMTEQAGLPSFDEDGMMKRGVIVRHLILPGHYEETREILRYLHKRYGDRIYISLMNQYTRLRGQRIILKSTAKSRSGTTMHWWTTR